MNGGTTFGISQNTLGIMAAIIFSATRPPRTIHEAVIEAHEIADAIYKTEED